MSNYKIKPCEELKHYISHFWAADWGEQSQDTNSTYFVTANSMTEIAFAFRGDDLLYAAIQGHTSRPNQFYATGFYKMFGVSLYSYALPYLFDLPALELNDLFLLPETLLGNEGKWLTEQIVSSRYTQERIDIFTRYCLMKLKKGRWGDHLVVNAAQHIRKFNGNLNIADLSNDFCLSQKQFERKFRTNTGFNPKLYARIVRFENALQSRSGYKTLTETAHANGYYDQAHFIHDFKKFSGYNPNEFFAISGY